jgi:hypothetical protein
MDKIPKGDQSQNTSRDYKSEKKNRWANTDPWKYRMWDQVPRRSKHPMLIYYTRHEPSSVNMNAELSPVMVNVPSTV